jgi:hypothetical protein
MIQQLTTRPRRPSPYLPRRLLTLSKFLLHRFVPNMHVDCEWRARGELICCWVCLHTKLSHHLKVVQLP